MNPLIFIDWFKLHRWFRNLMWLVLLALVIYIIAAFTVKHPSSHPSKHPVVTRMLR